MVREARHGREAAKKPEMVWGASKLAETAQKKKHKKYPKNLAPTIPRWPAGDIFSVGDPLPQAAYVGSFGSAACSEWQSRVTGLDLALLRLQLSVA